MWPERSMCHRNSCQTNRYHFKWKDHSPESLCLTFSTGVHQSSQVGVYCNFNHKHIPEGNVTIFLQHNEKNRNTIRQHKCRQDRPARARKHKSNTAGWDNIQCSRQEQLEWIKYCDQGSKLLRHTWTTHPHRGLDREGGSTAPNSTPLEPKARVALTLARPHRTPKLLGTALFVTYCILATE